MIKTITIFKKVKDFDALLNYYLNDIFPILQTVPGVFYTDIIKVEQMSPDCPEELKDLQIIMETYFESQVALGNMLESDKGMEIMKKIQASPFECEQYVFYGNIKRFHSNSDYNYVK